jgi:hypothetical protein
MVLSLEGIRVYQQTEKHEQDSLLGQEWILSLA